VLETARITYADGRIVYEAEIKPQKGEKADFLFSADGVLIQK
jgi:hypothetical protein